MGVDRQDQALAGVVGDVVVRLRGVPQPDQDAVLVGVVLHPVRTGRRAEVVRAGLQRGVVGHVLTVLDQVVLVVVLAELAGDPREAGSGPAVVAVLGAVGEHGRAVRRHRDLVQGEALHVDARVGGVVEADLDRLAGVGVQRERQVAPAVRAAGDGVLRQRGAVEGARQRGPVLAAVGGDLGVRVVVVLLQVVPGLRGELGRGLAGQVDVTGQRDVQVVGAAAPPLVAARERGVDLGDDGLRRQVDDQALLALGVVLDRAEQADGVLAGLGGVVVQPAELQLRPDVQVVRHVADLVLALAEPGARGHQGPETDRVVDALAAGVVQVRQAQVVAVLVGEHAQAAVLRLHGVVADPQAGGADRGAAQLVVVRAGLARLVGVHVRAVRPQRVVALDAAAGGLVLTGVDDLEVVQVAVRLVEVAVAVEVVTVPLVVLRQVGLDLGVGAALGLLVGDPGVDAVADQVLRVGADVLAAVVRAVAGLVPRHPHPVGDQAVDRVPARGLALVVGLQRGLVGREVQVLVVGLVVVRLPRRGVVLGAVRGGDLVARRAGGAAVLHLAVGGGGGVVHLVTEVDENGEDPVGALAGQLDVLVAAQLHRGAAAVLLDLGSAVDQLLYRGLLLGLHLFGERALQLAGHGVVLDGVGRVLDDRRDRGGGGRARQHAGTERGGHRDGGGSRGNLLGHLQRGDVLP
ncbi:hypothetical protein KCH_34940 [Kitasatospora cheerisanensis KCTC 2395]|uniref:Uncharacterized protein n=1 Tax=Kitasatospora cheerisanensis KCTC 2395 TaxID=1348663 RepID=A0A066YUN9_9ACTN|nr:hypothetical protein KCH_34940 [Kitasatospora cheerisanensis KCTC 2395]